MASSPNIAPASLIPLISAPTTALYNTLTCLQQAVDNNFTPAFFVIASAGMVVHYEAVIKKYGMCPVLVAIEHGKNSAARTAVALLGTPHFF